MLRYLNVQYFSTEYEQYHLDTIIIEKLKMKNVPIEILKILQDFGTLK